jgi:hypothetical protein
MEETTWYITERSIPAPSLKVLMGYEKERKIIIGFWEPTNENVLWKTDYGQPIESPSCWTFLPSLPDDN